MKKEKITKFINKYSLSDNIKTVLWESNGKKLFTNFISDDKSMKGNVNLNNFPAFGDNFKMGVYDTSKLKKMIEILGEDIEVNLNENKGKLTSAEFTDGKTFSNFSVCEESIIPSSPQLKHMPEFDLSLKVDTDFIDLFNKASNALSEAETFTVIEELGKIKLVLGYTEKINSDTITLDIENISDGDNYNFEKISFNCRLFNEILKVNKDFEKVEFKISFQGLMYIKFEIEDFISEYYLVAVDLSEE